MRSVSRTGEYDEDLLQRATRGKETGQSSGPEIDSKIERFHTFQYDMPFRIQALLGIRYLAGLTGSLFLTMVVSRTLLTKVLQETMHTRVCEHFSRAERPLQRIGRLPVRASPA